MRRARPPVELVEISEKGGHADWEIVGECFTVSGRSCSLRSVPPSIVLPWRSCCVSHRYSIPNACFGRGHPTDDGGDDPLGHGPGRSDLASRFGRGAVGNSPAGSFRRRHFPGGHCAGGHFPRGHCAGRTRTASRLRPVDPAAGCRSAEADCGTTGIDRRADGPTPSGHCRSHGGRKGRRHRKERYRVGQRAQRGTACRVLQAQAGAEIAVQLPLPTLDRRLAVAGQGVRSVVGHGHTAAGDVQLYRHARVHADRSGRSVERRVADQGIHTDSPRADAAGRRSLRRHTRGTRAAGNARRIGQAGDSRKVRVGQPDLRAGPTPGRDGRERDHAPVGTLWQDRAAAGDRADQGDRYGRGHAGDQRRDPIDYRATRAGCRTGAGRAGGAPVEEVSDQPRRADSVRAGGGRVCPRREGRSQRKRRGVDHPYDPLGTYNDRGRARTDEGEHDDRQSGPIGDVSPG